MPFKIGNYAYTPTPYSHRTYVKVKIIHVFEYDGKSQYIIEIERENGNILGIRDDGNLFEKEPSFE